MDVYMPREDSFLLERCVKEHARGKVCDMGSGCGILSFAAAKAADEVFAVDVNPAAIEEIKRQVPLMKVKNVHIFLSHFFSKVPKGLMFDCIVCNPPYLPTDKRVPDVALDGGKNGYEWTLQFLGQAKHRLTNDGVILLLFSSLSKKRVIDHALDADGWTREAIAEENLDFETLYVYKLSRKRLIAKGKRGMVAAGVFRGKKIVVKEKNPASKEDTLQFEADVLRRVNALGIGPKFMFFRKGKLGMEFIDGVRIMDFLRSAEPDRCRRVLRDVLEQCFLLDMAGIVKEEMTNPYKHIIVRKGKSVFIDFDRSRIRGRADNVTQVLQFFCSRTMQELLEGKLKVRRVSPALLGGYKRLPSRAAFLRILAEAGLASFNERCYALLSQVPGGKVTTYESLAKALSTKAYRAVGNAMNKNPYAPEIPCHRVVKSDGSIGGFAGGVKKKAGLLAEEEITVQKGKIVNIEDHLFMLS